MSFAFGFVCAWILSGILFLLADVNNFFERHFGDILVLPLIPFIPVVWFLRIMGTFLIGLYSPWKYVFHPIDEEKFNTLVEKVHGEMKKVSKNIWLFMDSDTKVFGHKRFFVRIKRSKLEGETP